MIKVLAGVIEKDSKILIARRKQNSHLAGKWEFPGGKLEANETQEECLFREIFEELGIKIKVCEFICSSKYSYEHISIELLAYMAQYISGEVFLTDHDEVRWVSKTELNNYIFAEADVPVVNKLIELI
ncbi:MAG: 8-oxo-dGTP diphosphatase MutT [Candidatus Gastranaerophilales bacterium]|nr:8-oxo-dGTP diphosphatase MutT [Candidatus Gastranaerophilales bacterium]